MASSNKCLRFSFLLLYCAAAKLQNLRGRMLSDDCYIHSGCTTGVAGYSLDASNSMGVGWYCTDGEEVGPSSDFDKCDKSLAACSSGLAYWKGDYAWSCDESVDTLGYCTSEGDPEKDPTANFCGGSTDPWTELSCSMYSYRPFTFNKAHGNDGQSCGNDGVYLGIMANGENYDPSGNSNPNSNTNAWASDFSGNNEDYFVFHGCDGAGLQSDCVGDIKYIERLSYLYTDDNTLQTDRVVDGMVSSGRKFGEAYPEGMCGQQDFPSGDQRTYCKFVHPGTERVYSDYHGGWWGVDADEDSKFGSKGMGFIKEGDFASAASGDWSGPLKSNVMAIPDRNFGGRHPFAGDGDNFSFMLFDYRCEASPADSNYFSYPSIASNGRKCFVDNEPGSLGYPPHVEIYFGTLTQDTGGKDMVKMLRWDSDVDGNITPANDDTDSPYITYPVHKHDGSNVPY